MNSILNSVISVLLAILISLALIAGIIDYWERHDMVETATAPSAKKTMSGGIAYKYFMAFSIYTNTKKLLSTRKSPDDMGCLHGIRFLSTAWVVLAHTYSASLTGPVWNLLDVKNVLEKNLMLILSSKYCLDRLNLFDTDL